MKAWAAFLAVIVLLVVMLTTSHNGQPHGIGWAALAILAVGALRLYREI